MNVWVLLVAAELAHVVVVVVSESVSTQPCFFVIVCLRCCYCCGGCASVFPRLGGRPRCRTGRTVGLRFLPHATRHEQVKPSLAKPCPFHSRPTHTRTLAGKRSLVGWMDGCMNGWMVIGLCRRVRKNVNARHGSYTEANIYSKINTVSITATSEGMQE